MQNERKTVEHRWATVVIAEFDRLGNGTCPQSLAGWLDLIDQQLRTATSSYPSHGFDSPVATFPGEDKDAAAAEIRGRLICIAAVALRAVESMEAAGAVPQADGQSIDEPATPPSPTVVQIRGTSAAWPSKPVVGIPERRAEQRHAPPLDDILQLHVLHTILAAEHLVDREKVAAALVIVANALGPRLRGRA